MWITKEPSNFITKPSKRRLLRSWGPFAFDKAGVGTMSQLKIRQKRKNTFTKKHRSELTKRLTSVEDTPRCPSGPCWVDDLSALHRHDCFCISFEFHEADRLLFERSNQVNLEVHQEVDQTCTQRCPKGQSSHRTVLVDIGDTTNNSQSDERCASMHLLAAFKSQTASASWSGHALLKVKHPMILCAIPSGIRGCSTQAHVSCHGSGMFPLRR